MCHNYNSNKTKKQAITHPFLMHICTIMIKFSNLTQNSQINSNVFIEPEPYH